MAGAGWAEELQAEMRRRGLTESGRLIAPILRPFFITRQQLDSLTRISEQLAVIIHRLQTMALETPALLQRLGMLPAEKLLATVGSGYPARTVTSRLDTHVNNGSLSVGGFDACRSSAFIYSLSAAKSASVRSLAERRWIGQSDFHWR